MEEIDFKIKNICLKLAQVRISKNLAAFALSTMLGKNKNYISRIEAGTTNITLKALLEICQVLEVDPKELF